MRIRLLVVLVVLGVLGADAGSDAFGQVRLSPQVDEVLDTERPRIATAADGSFAVAWGAYRRTDFVEQWQVAVQRFAPDGRPVGLNYHFGGESCSGTDLWSSDYMDHAELAFQPAGILAVLMTHSGYFSLLGASDLWSTEQTVAAIDAGGQVLDLHSSTSCVQRKLFFRESGGVLRGRLAFTPGGALLIAADSRFDGDHGEARARNVAVRIDDAQGNEVVAQWVPHTDPASATAFHAFPDVAAGADRFVVVWHECPYDAQGNAAECDVAAQFVSTTGGQLQALGGNVRVNAGDPAGTYSIWPAAAMNGAGNGVVAWADTRTRAGGDVFAQRFNAAGQPVGGNIQVSTGQGDLDARPEVAMLEDGRFMVVWMDSSAVGYRARGRQYDAAGAPLGAPFELAGFTTLETGLPAVAPYGSAYLYAWAAGRRGAPTAIYVNALGRIVDLERPETPVAAALRLTGAYPNPFDRASTLSYSLAETGPVTLVVHDVLGREVARLVDAVQGPGTYEARLDGTALAPGLYLARLQQGPASHVRPVILQR